MDEAERLAAENAKLREQLEAYRLRELTELREQLSQAKADAAHYRAEAERNANVGRQIHAEAQAELTELRSRLAAMERIPNARNLRPTGSG